MTNTNPFANYVATIQGVTIGGPEYNAAGLLPYASQTGGHAAYGWNHSFKLTPSFVRAAVVNLWSRPWFYENEDYRQANYNIACRPVGWVPVEQDDLANGRKRYGNVSVSCPEHQHFWLDPHWDIIDAKDATPIKLMPNGPALPAHTMSAIGIRYGLRALAGIIRQVGPYMAGGRATARVLDTVNRARQRNMLADDEGKVLGKVFADWIENYALPQLETAPGVREAKGEGVCRWVQEWGWMMLPLYEAQTVWANYKDFGPRFAAITKQRAQWGVDIEQIAGGRAKWYNLRITDAMKAGVNGKPLDTLVGAITASDLMGPDDYSLWSLTASDVARATLGTASAEALYQGVVAKAVANAGPADKCWLVDRNRKPLEPQQ